MAESYYKVTVYDGEKTLFEKDIPVSDLSSTDLHGLLRSLVASYGNLNGDEITGSHLKNDAAGHRDLLTIGHQNLAGKRGYMLTCGENPHATLVEVT